MRGAGGPGFRLALPEEHGHSSRSRARARPIRACMGPWLSRGLIDQGMLLPLWSVSSAQRSWLSVVPMIGRVRLAAAAVKAGRRPPPKGGAQRP